jgi:hypothetical protein
VSLNRRQFVTRVSFGAAAMAALPRSTAAATSGRLTVRFVGMMTFIEREDHSFLVATPGQSSMHHMVHTPFLMARAGSPIAKAFGMVPVPGVIPEAFDMTLEGTAPGQFVYHSLENAALEITSGAGDLVRNDSTQLALMNRIAPGKRVRGNIEKWASATVSLRGGRIEDSAAHPDAGKVWEFGDYRQRVTDAVNFHNLGGATTTIRLTSGIEARALTVRPGENAELWVFSAATPGEGIGQPSLLDHSELLFDYLVDAKPVLARCPEATGRLVPRSTVPFVRPSSASLGNITAEAGYPPYSELCVMAAKLLDRN